jgi:predicted metal-dependent hydrolase
MFEPATPQLALWPAEDAVDGWKVRESRRARRLIVRVHHTGRVEVIVPRRTSPRTVARFLDRHREWIERKREEARRAITPTQSIPPQEAAALRRALIAKAHAVLAPMLAETARELGFSYERIMIRRQRTRWGSCSARGTISLNCCLLFQRPPVVRYLLIHELSHTRHLNHSKRFWQCVARHCPDYRALDRELRDGWKRVPGWLFDS